MSGLTFTMTGTLIDEIETDDDGDFPWVTFTVPEGPAGVHKVRAEVNSTRLR